jgi:predicted glycoside hydrolase/deacetylase ChbG (UPF0249 family)
MGRPIPSTGCAPLGRASKIRRLIVNADDLGLSPAVNRGIIELQAAGIVTSASLLMNLPATADALDRTADGRLDVGVHLNLTVGRPLSGPAPGLVGRDGRLAPLPVVVRRLLRGELRLATVEREWAAQIEALLATGRRAAHLDSHQHLHALPGLLGLAGRLARRYDIGALRLPGHGLVLHQAMPLLPARLVGGWRLGGAGGAVPWMPDGLVVLAAYGRPCVLT